MLSLISLLLIFCPQSAIPAIFFSAKGARELACSQNSELVYCKDFQGEYPRRPQTRTVMIGSGVQAQANSYSGEAEEDESVCRELRQEYHDSCVYRRESGQEEFCSAFESVCLSAAQNDDESVIVAQDEADDDSAQAESTLARRQRVRPNRKETALLRRKTSLAKGNATTVSPVEEDTLPSPCAECTHPEKLRKLPPSKRDYTEFCAEYKQRFRYVCPDPFRFGEKAAIFCPVYSERCRLPVPDRPVMPTQNPPSSHNRRDTTNELCGQFRNFASNYCGNPTAVQYSPSVRDGCSRYKRFCENSQIM
ncbi:hypothetical protein Ddc_04628 [Ditylenchus destructor]|nr:hypothetical protein Ddc_04628 [Ditylenchus destructor]